MRQERSEFDYEGFDWDERNIRKNESKHGARYKECEEIFFNKPLIIFKDTAHSQKEERFAALGKTNLGRKLALSFCIRQNKIRVISARDQDKKERKFFACY